MKRLLLFFYCITLFLILLSLNIFVLEGIPHVPDDAAYFFMAKLFASGHIIQPIPISPGHVNFFPGILDVSKGTWLFQYPFGHPLVLAIGVLLKIPNAIPPLIGTLFVLILFLIAKEVYDKKTSWFILLLPLLSPFFLENASSFMSHNTAAFYLVCSLYCLIQSTKKYTWYWSFLSGVFVGLLFNTRPLTAIPFFIIFLFLVTKSSQKKFPAELYFVLGFLLLLAAWLLYNYSTTGNFLSSQYFSNNQHLFTDNIQTFLHSRVTNTFTLFKNYGPMLFNWPEIITYAVLGIPFFTKEKKAWDGIFLLCILVIPFVYFFYDGTFIMYGPRFWYETIPFVFLLTSHCFSIFYSYLKKTTLLFILLLSILSLGRFSGWLPTHNPDIFSPLSMKNLQSFNFTDGRILCTVKTLNVHHAIVFVKDCDNNWWCYGSVFPQNSPDLQTDIIYVKDLGTEKNFSFVTHFANRMYFCADYNANTLTKIKLYTTYLEQCP